MSRTVLCRKYQREMEGLATPPFPGPRGQRIFDTVSRQAWQAWIAHQTLLINERRLNMMDRTARAFLEEEMEKFFANESVAQADGYVPPAPPAPPATPASPTPPESPAPGAPVVKLGPVAHIGLAVKDCNKTAAFYTRMFGIEFAIDDYDMGEGMRFNIDGKPARARFRAAFGKSGAVSIELVEVLEGETPHTRFLQKHGEGMQHLCFYVENMEETVAALQAEGFRATLDYEFETTYEGKRSRIQETYLNTEEHLGGMTIQLLQVDALP